MDVTVGTVTPLVFDDGAPVRAASAVVPFGGGWLVAQDDATHAAWVRDGSVSRVRVLPPVAGLDTFEEAAGTKHLKPDLEGAFPVPHDPRRVRPFRPHRADMESTTSHPAGAVVLLGSGSSPARTRAVLLRPEPTEAGAAVVADLSPLYAAAGSALDAAPDVLNFEGACVVDGALRWFQRGVPAAGVPTASVDVDLATLLAALTGDVPPEDVPVSRPRRYDLGSVDGVGLAVTDAVSLGGGAMLVSAAAEDTDDPRDDGPVVGSVLAVLDGDAVVAGARLPVIEGTVPKIEGLAVVGGSGAGAAGGDVHLLATIDADDPGIPSLAVRLRVRW